MDQRVKGQPERAGVEFIGLFLRGWALRFPLPGFPLSIKPALDDLEWVGESRCGSGW